MRKSRLRALLLAAALAAGVFGTGAARAADEGTVSNGTVTSADGTLVYYSLFKPNSASASSKVPMIFHSHGWGGSRSKSVADFNDWLADGFGVLSFDQRGHGESTDVATVEDPAREGADVSALIDFVANLDWVQTEGPGDPVLGAIGGSYGGGYQTIGSLSDLQRLGRQRFNALAPEITWYDLPDSLAPQLVPRTLWTTLLYAIAPPHADYIDQGEAIGLATATFPDGTLPVGPNLQQIFYEHSPKWFSDHGYHLDIPVLFGQGITDNLFNLNQGIHNYQQVLTAAARSKSIFVGYNSGHVLPELLPPSTNPDGNPCVTDWGKFERAFFHAAFAGLNPRAELDGLHGPVKAFNIATSDNGCLRTDDITTYQSYPVAPAGTVASTTVAGAPIAYQIASGPLNIAGIPHLKGSLTTLVADARAFFAVSVGATPVTAQVVQNNLLPIRRLLPTVGEALDLELPGIGIEVPAGMNVYLTVSPVATEFLGTSRLPGIVLIQDATVELPVR
jgi:ABC-2 type transport system ATP-binding protein